jgi:DNA-binding CsgD family transcriptional regulator
VTAVAPNVAELIDRAAAADSVRDLFAAASTRLRRLVPFDSAAWLATDPATSLPTSPTRAENMGHFGGQDACLRLWELEFLVEDVNLFQGLAGAPQPAAGLRETTHGAPARSSRYREFLRPHGFADELRAVLRAGGRPWATITLLRRDGEPAFDAREVALAASLSEPLAEAVRAQRARPFAHAADRGPGLMVFDRDGELVSINDDAAAWLDELAGDLGGETMFGVRLPMVVISTLMRARAIAAGRDRRTARARMRSNVSERWLVCHASCLRDEDGEIGNTALVIEAATSSEMAPIITEAYELSPREREITQLIARGLGTSDIAAALHLSTHTVRDYVKTVFDKVGVSSRGELVAKLFAEHYAPLHFDPSGLDEIEDGASPVSLR